MLPSKCEGAMKVRIKKRVESRCYRRAIHHKELEYPMVWAISQHSFVNVYLCIQHNVLKCLFIFNNLFPPASQVTGSPIAKNLEKWKKDSIVTFTQRQTSGSIKGTLECFLQEVTLNDMLMVSEPSYFESSTKSSLTWERTKLW